MGSVLAAVQVERLGQPGPSGTQLLGVFGEDDPRPAALCWAGANLVRMLSSSGSPATARARIG
ncbi:MAG: hypothetical protein B7Z14_07170 [Bosea sp. 32-68-6]|nr:MAG: hypothetical protein B7Z14_07170 [Bosea sp. 32-68-6]